MSGNREGKGREDHLMMLCVPSTPPSSLETYLLLLSLFLFYLQLCIPLAFSY